MLSNHKKHSRMIRRHFWMFSHRKKKMKKLKKKLKSGQMDVREDNPFEMFVAATNIKLVHLLN